MPHVSPTCGFVFSASCGLSSVDWRLVLRGQFIQKTKEIADVKKPRAACFSRLAQRRDAHVFSRGAVEQLIEAGVGETGEVASLPVWRYRSVNVGVIPTIRRLGFRRCNDL